MSTRLRERMLPPTLVAAAAALSCAAIWAAAASAGAPPPVQPPDGFAGPVENPPRAIQRLDGPAANAGLLRVACPGDAAGASCYVAAP